MPKYTTRHRTVEAWKFDTTSKEPPPIWVIAALWNPKSVGGIEIRAGHDGVAELRITAEMHGDDQDVIDIAVNGCYLIHSASPLGIAVMSAEEFEATFELAPVAAGRVREEDPRVGGS